MLDCQNQVVLQSEVGSSKDKDYEQAYREALEEAILNILPKLKSLARKNQIQGSSTSTESPDTIADNEETDKGESKSDITVTKNSRGYTLVTANNIVIQLQITSQQNVFLAFLDTKPAIGFYNAGKLLLEYYETNRKVTLNYDVKLPQ
ncbi:hypothetical protein CHX27_10670 [Flavobacterium aurantiibacter]|uniref:Uncharacterized protein n=1 Tax=Flavobacterium aurantiibacter TaxID=2023067 RepID=A0A255ZR53_9FLAO|nr:hypothetical protein CHX27_10670 [Flavobacterium aurantiibacter]